MVVDRNQRNRLDGSWLVFLPPDKALLMLRISEQLLWYTPNSWANDGKVKGELLKKRGRKTWRLKFGKP